MLKMGFDFGDLLKAGKKIVKAGAPILGTAFGGPAGAAIAEMVMGDNGVDSDAPNALELLEQKLFANNAAALKKYEMDHAERIALIDREIRVTEAMVDSSKAQLDFDKAQIQSADKYVSRQRPTVMYGLLICLMANVFSNLYGNMFIKGFTPMWLPAAFFTLFGEGFLGYSYMRSSEKNGSDPIVGIVKGIIKK